jgi:hypothetical protein
VAFLLQVVCSKCRVEKLVTIGSLFTGGALHTHTFCVKCVHAAKQVDPRRVATSFVTHEL